MAANLITAALFGAAHVSDAFGASGPTLAVWLRWLETATIGLALGWLYLRRGIVAAIVAHVGIDWLFGLGTPLILWLLARLH